MFLYQMKLDSHYLSLMENGQSNDERELFEQILKRNKQKAYAFRS